MCWRARESRCFLVLLHHQTYLVLCDSLSGILFFIRPWFFYAGSLNSSSFFSLCMTMLSCRVSLTFKVFSLHWVLYPFFPETLVCTSLFHLYCNFCSTGGLIHVFTLSEYYASVGLKPGFTGLGVNLTGALVRVRELSACCTSPDETYVLV